MFVPVGAIKPSTAYKHRVLAKEKENEVQALFSATLASPDADTATISLTWMAFSPLGFVTRRNCARQASGVSDGVADRDLVADAERDAVDTGDAADGDGDGVDGNCDDDGERKVATLRL